METPSNRPAPVELPTNTSVVATMRGKAVREGGFWVIKGKWSMGWNHPIKSDFHYRAAGFSPDSERPYCGRYEGWFSLLERGNRSRRFSEKSLEMSFTANSEGGYNIEGMSVTELASTRIVGLVAPDKKVRLLKMHDGPSGVPVPQPAARPVPARGPVRKPKANGGRRKGNDVWARCKKIMDALSENLDKAFWFNESWEKTAENFPDYRSRIERPMDFPLIKAKLRQRKYKTPAEFAADVRLTFSNAKTYHPMESHPCHRSAVELSKIFEEKFAAIESMPVPPPPVPRPKAVKKAPKAMPKAAPKPIPAVSARPAPKEQPLSGNAGSMAIPRRVRQDRPSQTHSPVGPPLAPKTRPNKSSLQSNHDWQKEAMQIIRFCLHDPDSAWFRLPVPSDLRGYTKIIKRPMDFSTLKSQLRAKKYATMDDFMGDARLIFTNAMTFNRKGEPCYVAAEKVLQLMEQKYRDLTGERSSDHESSKNIAASTVQKPHAKVEVQEQSLTEEEKERLEEDVGLLQDADVEKILDMITESGEGANEDGEVDLDKLSISLARKIQSFVKRCLRPDLFADEEKPETDAEKDDSKEGDGMDVEADAAAEDGTVANAASSEPQNECTEADSHAMRGKTVDAPPVKVPADQEKPDSAKTDRENSPRDSPSSPVTENPRVGELPRQSNLFERVASQIDGDRTSSSDEESEEELPVTQLRSEGSVKRKREDPEEVASSKKAKVDAPSGEQSMEVERHDSETAEAVPEPVVASISGMGAGKPDGEPALQRNPSLSSWITSAAKFDEKLAPKERLRADSLDQDSRLWAESQKKSEELKTIEKIRREEEEERKALLEKKRDEEEKARLRAAEERKKLLRQEEERLEKQKQQEVEERTRLAREGAKDAPKVNLDEDENLLEEFL